jgi:hypothetical protein
MAKRNMPYVTSFFFIKVHVSSSYLYFFLSFFLKPASPQLMNMLGNSYPTSGVSLSQNQIQAGNNSLSSMGMLHDASDTAPFDINDFPQLTGRPSSAGGPQGQYGKSCGNMPYSILGFKGYFANSLKLQDRYANKELVLVPSFSRIKNSVFRMKIFQLCPDSKVVLVKFIVMTYLLIYQQCSDYAFHGA